MNNNCVLNTEPRRLRIVNIIFVNHDAANIAEGFEYTHVKNKETKKLAKRT